MSEQRAKTREMYAPVEWYRQPYPSLRDDVSGFNPVRVLVTEIPEGMPAFEVGDRVRYRPAGTVSEVMHHPIHVHGEWYVPVATAGYHSATLEMWLCEHVQPLPREITRTIRVTGPEDDVEDFVDLARKTPDEMTRLKNVRVEITNAD